MCPLAERHNDNEPQEGDYQVNGICIICGQRKSKVSEDMNGNPGQGHEKQQNQEHPVSQVRKLVDFLTFPDAAYDGFSSENEESSRGEVTHPSLRMVDGIDIVCLEPFQEDDNQSEHDYVTDYDQEVFYPAALIRTFEEILLSGCMED